MLPIASKHEGIGTLPLQGVFKKKQFIRPVINYYNSTGHYAPLVCRASLQCIKKICGLPLKKDTKLSRIGSIEDYFKVC